MVKYVHTYLYNPLSDWWMYILIYIDILIYIYISIPRTEINKGAISEVGNLSELENFFPENSNRRKDSHSC